WAGLVSRQECGALMARARAAVLPSVWQETFGLVAVEAMAAGAVPVAAAHGSFPDLIADGIDGVLFPPGSASALAEVFCDMDARPERYAQMGQAAYRTYQRRFTQATNIEQLLRIYRFAIDHPLG
ncbi:MAG: glycosyltransferase, partial [Actinomycetota bacterium]|nr:glycosyltransferase [Actinomycetota bacterium]